MTTTARPGPGHHPTRTPRVLAAAAAGLVGAVALAVLVASLVGGRPAALGVGLGGAVALAFFLFGSGTVMVATRIAPQASLLVALMTFTLQVVLVAAVFAALGSSGVVGSTVSAPGLAVGVLVAAGAWIVGQLVAHARIRVPVYDLDLAASSSSGPGGRQAGAR